MFRAIVSATVPISRSAFRGIQTGTVKTFGKGYGFITPSDGGSDIFVHQTQIKKDGFRNLAVGEEVEFDVVTENGKSKAINVTGPGGRDVVGAQRERFEENSNDRFQRGSRREY